jgi:hypothetical protein
MRSQRLASGDEELPSTSTSYRSGDWERVLRVRIASNSRELPLAFLYSVTVAGAKEDHILLVHVKSVLARRHFLAQRVTHNVAALHRWRFGLETKRCARRRSKQNKEVVPSDDVAQRSGSWRLPSKRRLLAAPLNDPILSLRLS